MPAIGELDASGFEGSNNLVYGILPAAQSVVLCLKSLDCCNANACSVGKLVLGPIDASMDSDEDLASSARLLVEQAAKMAEDLNEKYQQGSVGMRKEIDRRIDEDDPTAKAFILRELDACERRLRETRTQDEAISVEARA